MELEMVEAVVQVGAVETVYLRAGRGERVAVVLAADAAERLRLVRRFAACYRVVAPVPPVPPAGSGGAAHTAAWLHGVIDGLGLDRPTLVLEPALSLLAEQLWRGVAWVGDVVIAAQDDEPDAFAPLVAGD